MDDWKRLGRYPLDCLYLEYRQSTCSSALPLGYRRYRISIDNFARVRMFHSRLLTFCHEAFCAIIVHAALIVGWNVFYKRDLLAQTVKIDITGRTIKTKWNWCVCFIVELSLNLRFFVWLLFWLISCLHQSNRFQTLQNFIVEKIDKSDYFNFACVQN